LVVLITKKARNFDQNNF